MTLKDILRLEMLRGEKATRNWLFLLGILVYMFISIWLSHVSEIKAVKMSKLTAENRRLRSEYVSLKSMLMQQQLRSNVYDKLKNDGFIIPKRPPVQIELEE